MAYSEENFEDDETQTIQKDNLDSFFGAEDSDSSDVGLDEFDEAALNDLSDEEEDVSLYVEL